MAITLDTVTLPAGLIWANEWAWTGVARVMEKSLTGVPVIQITPLTSGRAITFDGRERAAWMTRAELAALAALVPLEGDRTLTLHDGRHVAVQFQDPPYEVEQLIPLDDAPLPQDRYVLLTLNLITTGEMQLPEEP